MTKIKEEVIQYLPFPDCIRKRVGMYLGDVSNASICLREIVDNSTDELAAGYGDTVIISNDFNGFKYVSDNGRGIPIAMSLDKPGVTQAFLSISDLHTGSKFTSTSDSRAGMNGIGSSSVNACSEIYVLMSRITEDNYTRSIPEVRNLWESSGPRSKRDLFYIVVCERGIKVFEGAAKLRDIEKKLFSGIPGYVSIPEGQSTIVLFKPDTSIFESTKASIPVINLQYFLMIQEKFFGRKLNIISNGAKLGNTIKPYKFEAFKTIVPKDTSKNSQVSMYITFEYDPGMSNKSECGSVNGLEVNNGQHVTIAESCIKTALRDIYKIKHDYLLNGLQMRVIILASEVVFSEQIKSNLRSISKVKVTDFVDLVKEVEKVMKKNSAYFDQVVMKLNKLADSMRDLGAAELGEKFMDGSSGVGLYRNKTSLVPGFTDATGKNRQDCELFLCFTGDTEVSTLGNRPVTFAELSTYSFGQIYYIASYATDWGRKDSIHALSRVLACKKIKTVNKTIKVTLDNGKWYKSTPDHKMLIYDCDEVQDLDKPFVYKETQELEVGSKLFAGRLDWWNPESWPKYHTVTKIEEINGEGQDVYCLEVDLPCHNFTLSCGVIAKNCEGLSAAGSLVAARPDTTKHAIVPLRGKILNVTGVSVKRAMESSVIYSIFSVIGLGLDANNVVKDCKTEEEALEVIKQKSRYGKIIIATDADQDGSMIAAELLHMFSKFARFMIDLGLIYRAISPLWKGKSKTTGKMTYYYPDDQYNQNGFPVDMDEHSHYYRYKGLT